MTWEETIKYIRTKPEYKTLVEKAYFEKDIALNIERFRVSEEFLETLRLLRLHHPNAQNILDIGCGNGISSIAFALEGYHVVSVEPDNSDTIGAGAIRKMKQQYKLTNIEVYEAFAEDIAFPSENFDVVYIRQAMHHANDLNKFIGEAGRVLKCGGILFTVRDHIIFNDLDKAWFLEKHPLQKFYGGENAFTTEEYKKAMNLAGLNVLLELKFFDNVINFFPLNVKKIRRKKQIAHFLTLIPTWLLNRLPKRFPNLVEDMNEKNIPGRMYSYIAIKPQ
jgi:ubiquinone/menaquinone biosynthesis C-methylase UbiE